MLSNNGAGKTFEELETDPLSRFLTTDWTEPTKAESKLVLPDDSKDGGHLFWVVGDDGAPRRMMWTEDGRMVDVDQYSFYD